MCFSSNSLHYTYLRVDNLEIEDGTAEGGRTSRPWAKPLFSPSPPFLFSEPNGKFLLLYSVIILGSLMKRQVGLRWNGVSDGSPMMMISSWTLISAVITCYLERTVENPYPGLSRSFLETSNSLEDSCNSLEDSCYRSVDICYRSVDSCYRSFDSSFCHLFTYFVILSTYFVNIFADFMFTKICGKDDKMCRKDDKMGYSKNDIFGNNSLKEVQELYNEQQFFWVKRHFKL